MTPEEYKFLYELEEHHWWFEGMRRITAALLDSRAPAKPLRILDAGCGTGFMLLWLARYSRSQDVFGVDISSNALRFCSARRKSSLVQSSLTNLPFPADTFDLITTFDVLDEISSAGVRLAYAELARVLKRGGVLLVRVPAFQWLYSDHDKAIGTQHRYVADELVECLAGQSLELDRVTYANTLLFPVAVLWRWLRGSRLHRPHSDVRPLPRSLRWLNPFLVQLLAVEAAWLKHFRWRLPVGLSVIAIARKTMSHR